MPHPELAGRNGFGQAIEARQVVDQRTVKLARLRWMLDDQARRVERCPEWLAASAPRPDPPPAPREFGRPADRAVAAPAPQAGGRTLRVTVSESRAVSLTVEDKIPAPARLAS